MALKTAKLILLPNLLSEEHQVYRDFLPAIVEEKIQELDGLFAESEKGGRHYLKRFPFPEGKTFREVPIRLLNEHTQDKDLKSLFEPVLQGQVWGVVSDAGLPCLADPGAKLVMMARKHKIPVEVCSGPSSVFFALMLSGLSAQRFAFHGYLERDREKRKLQIQRLEKESKDQHMTQVFIEAPYRCGQMLDDLAQILQPTTVLSVCKDLTTKEEWVETQRVDKWRSMQRPDLHKKLVVFLFSA